MCIENSFSWINSVQILHSRGKNPGFYNSFQKQMSRQKWKCYSMCMELMKPNFIIVALKGSASFLPSHKFFLDIYPEIDN